MSQHKMMNSNLTESRKKGFMVAKFSQLLMVSSTVGVYAGCWVGLTDDVIASIR